MRTVTELRISKWLKINFGIDFGFGDIYYDYTSFLSPIWCMRYTRVDRNNKLPYIYVVKELNRLEIKKFII